MQTVQEEYKALRSQYPYLSAKSALDWARSKAAPQFWDIQKYVSTGNYANERRTFGRDGFTITVYLEVDEYPEYPFGHFTSKPSNHAIINHPRDRNSHKYFVPEITFQDHFVGLRDTHYSKQDAYVLARKYVRDDMKRARDWSPYFLIVSVNRAGVELASESLGGIDDLDHAWSEAETQINEALATAQAKLNELCECA